MDLVQLRFLDIDNVLSSYKLLQARNRFVTSNEILFDPSFPLRIELNGYFEVDPEFIGSSGVEPIREEFTISAELKGMEIRYDLLLALDLDALGELTLGHFVDILLPDQNFTIADTAVDCFFHSLFVDGLFFPELIINISSGLETLSINTTNNIISPAVEALISEIITIAAQFYADAVPFLCQNCLREWINEEAASRKSSESCPEFARNAVFLSETDRIFRPAENEVIQRIQALVDTESQRLNTFISDLTQGETFLRNSPSGFLENVSLVLDGNKFGSFSLLISDIKLAGLDTFTRVEILKPTAAIGEPEDFTTRTAIDITGPVTFDFVLTVLIFDVFQQDRLLRNELLFELDVRQVSFLLELFLRVDLEKALHLRVKSLLDFSNETLCIFYPIQQIDVKDYVLDTEQLDLRFTCAGICEFPELATLGAGADFQSRDGEDLSAILKRLLDFLRAYILSSEFDSFLSSTLTEAEALCDPNATLRAAPLAEDFAALLGISFASALVCAAAASLCLIPVHRRRKDSQVAMYAEKGLFAELSQEDSRLLASILALRATALAYHPSVPLRSRYAVPLVCLANIVLLLVAVIEVSALEIRVVADVLGATTQPLALQPFTIGSTVNSMWESGYLFLAVMLGWASIGWPVVQNAVLVLLWVIPQTILSRSDRRRACQMLCFASKWAFLEVYVLVFTVASVQTYIRQGAVSREFLLSASFFQGDVEVNPELGMVLLAVVAVSSLLTAQMLLFYAFKENEWNMRLEDEFEGISIAVSKASRARQRMRNQKLVTVGVTIPQNRLNILLYANLGATLLLLIGLALPLVSFEIAGLFGVLLKIVEGDKPLAVKTFSLVTLGSLVENGSSEALAVVGKVVVEVLFYVITIVFPILLGPLLVVLFTQPLSLNEQRALLSIAFGLSYWSALEVFALGGLAIVLSIDTVASTTFEVLDDQFCSFVKAFLQANQTAEVSDDQGCFDLLATLEPSSALIILAIVLQLAAMFSSLLLASVFVQDREYRDWRRLRSHISPQPLGRIRTGLLRLFGQGEVKPIPADNAVIFRHWERNLFSSKGSKVSKQPSASALPTTTTSSGATRPEDRIHLILGARLHNRPQSPPPPTSGPPSPKKKFSFWSHRRSKRPQPHTRSLGLGSLLQDEDQDLGFDDDLDLFEEAESIREAGHPPRPPRPGRGVNFDELKLRVHNRKMKERLLRKGSESSPGGIGAFAARTLKRMRTAFTGSDDPFDEEGLVAESRESRLEKQRDPATENLQKSRRGGKEKKEPLWKLAQQDSQRMPARKDRDVAAKKKSEGSHGDNRQKKEPKQRPKQNEKKKVKVKTEKSKQREQRPKKKKRKSDIQAIL